MVNYSSEFHIYLEIMLTFSMKLFCPFPMKIVLEVTLNSVFLVLLVAFFNISSWILFPAEIYSVSFSIDLNRAAAAASSVNRFLFLKHAVRWFFFRYYNYLFCCVDSWQIHAGRTWIIDHGLRSLSIHDEYSQNLENEYWIWRENHLLYVYIYWQNL